MEKIRKDLDNEIVKLLRLILREEAGLFTFASDLEWVQQARVLLKKLEEVD
jgi:hypothetical protein